MTNNCIYCKAALKDQCVVDICDRCGVGVWGEKMFKAIVDGMEKARDTGDLNQGSVSNNPTDAQRFTP